MCMYVLHSMKWKVTLIFILVQATWTQKKINIQCTVQHTCSSFSTSFLKHISPFYRHCSLFWNKWVINLKYLELHVPLRLFPCTTYTLVLVLLCVELHCTLHMYIVGYKFDLFLTFQNKFPWKGHKLLLCISQITQLWWLKVMPLWGVNI